MRLMLSICIRVNLNTSTSNQNNSTNMEKNMRNNDTANDNDKKSYQLKRSRRDPDISAPTVREFIDQRSKLLASNSRALFQQPRHPSAGAADAPCSTRPSIPLCKEMEHGAFQTTKDETFPCFTLES